MLKSDEFRTLYMQLSINNSTQLHVDTYDSSQHQLLVLIAGAGAPAEFWPGEFCTNLANAGYYVARYSHRDTGLSTHFADKYPIDVLLDDLIMLIIKLQHSSAHLVGHSMGGYLCQMAMCRHPDFTISATSISAGPTVDPEDMSKLGMSSPPESTWQTLMKNQPAGDYHTDLSGWLQSWRFLNGSRPFEREMAEQYTRSLYIGDSRNAQVAINHISAMATFPRSLLSELKRTDCPLLSIHGTEDPLVPLDNGAASARLAPRGKLYHMPGAGHMFFHAESWREISQHILEHISESTKQVGDG